MTSIFLLFLYVAMLIDPIPAPWAKTSFWHRLPHRGKDQRPSQRIGNFLFWLLIPCILALGVWSAGYRLIAEAILLFVYGFLLGDYLLFCTTEGEKKGSSLTEELPENLIVWSGQRVTLDRKIFFRAQPWILPNSWVLEEPSEILKAVSDKAYPSFACSRALRITLTQAWDTHHATIEKQLDLLMKFSEASKINVGQVEKTLSYPRS